MIEIRRSSERGHANHGWLDSWHTFSFEDYFDPNHVEFGPLRVINEDRVMPGAGFSEHGHRDMEIISYVLEGELTHEDSTCTPRYVIHAGDVQRISAGRGVRHREFNNSRSRPVHFLQIWIRPNVLDVVPEYEEKHFRPEEKRGRLRLIVSPDRADQSICINQDVRIYAGLFDGLDQCALEFVPGRRGYVHVARGEILANGETLAAGDALKLTEATTLSLSAGRNAEVLVFDLPGERL
jgi:quercetin 2,3-dioxygenase